MNISYKIAVGCGIFVFLFSRLLAADSQIYNLSENLSGDDPNKLVQAFQHKISDSIVHFTKFQPEFREVENVPGLVLTDHQHILVENLFKEVEVLEKGRLRFRFRINELPKDVLEDQRGENIYLLGNSRRLLNFPGFRLYLSKDEEGGSYSLNHIVGDVFRSGVDLSARKGFLGSVQTGRWYELVVTFINAAKHPRIEYVFDGSFTRFDFPVSAGFAPNEFYKHLREAGSFQMGGADYYQQVLINDKEPFLNDVGRSSNMSLAIRDLQFYSSIAEPDSGELDTIFDALITHVQGDVPLSKNSLKEHKVHLYQNLNSGFGSSLLEKIKAYLGAYEKAHGSLFASQDYAPHNANETSQITFFVKQWILDNLYTSDSLTHLNGLSFLEASDWPGLPNQAAQNVAENNPTRSRINGSYSKDPGLQTNGDSMAYRLTGQYAPPGEVVTMQVPENVLNKGLQVLVGIHYWDASSVLPYRRFNRMGTFFRMNKAELQIVNPLGGSILVMVPDGSDLGEFDISIQGSLQTPYFSTKKDHMTTDSQWEKYMQAPAVPWVEFESDKVQLIAPKALFDKGNLTPKEILDQWDAILDSFAVVTGRRIQRAKPYMFFAERQYVVGGTAAPASDPMPLVPGVNVHSWENFLDPKPNSSSEGVSAEFIVLHEMGHAHNMPTLGYQEQESNVNLPAVAAYHLVYGYDRETEALAASIDQGLSLKQAAVDWMLSPNFPQNERISYDFEEWDQNWESESVELNFVWNEVRYQSRGHARYVDLAIVCDQGDANSFGWEAVGKTHSLFYDLGSKAGETFNYGTSDDDYIRKASYANGLNLAPLFHFWGVIPSDKLVVELNSFLPKAIKFKDRLLYYESIVPEDNQAFRAHFKELQEGSWTKGYWGDEANGFQLFRYKGLENAYNTDRAVAMIRQIKFLLNRYFPEDENPKSQLSLIEQPNSSFLHPGIQYSTNISLSEESSLNKPITFSLLFDDVSRTEEVVWSGSQASLQNDEVGGLAFDSLTGKISGTWNEHSGGDLPPYKIGVFDGDKILYSDPFQLRILTEDQPDKVLIKNLKDLTVNEGEELFYSFDLAFSTENAKKGLSFSIRRMNRPNEALEDIFEWMDVSVNEDNNGINAYGLTIKPRSSKDLSLYEDLFVLISNENWNGRSTLFNIAFVDTEPQGKQLELLGLPREVVLEGRPYEFTPLLFGPDLLVSGFKGEFSATLPEWLKINPSTGRIFGTAKGLGDFETRYEGNYITATSPSHPPLNFGPFSITVINDTKLQILNLPAELTLEKGSAFRIPIQIQRLGPYIDETEGDRVERPYLSDPYVNLRFGAGRRYDTKPSWVHYDGSSRPAFLTGDVPEDALAEQVLEFNIHGLDPFQTLKILVPGGLVTGNNNAPDNFSGLPLYQDSNSDGSSDGSQSPQPVAIEVSGGGFSDPFYTFTMDGAMVESLNGSHFKAGSVYEFKANGISLNHPFAVGISRDSIPSWITGDALTGSEGLIRVEIPPDYQGTITYYCTAHTSMTRAMKVGEADVDAFTVSGKVTMVGDASSLPVAGVSITLHQNGSDIDTLSDANGKYSFTIASGAGIELTANIVQGEGKARAGVDVADIVEMRKHILGRTPFGTSRKVIAGDTNRDGSVDVVDIVNVRNVILARNDFFAEHADGKKQTFWRFVDPDFSNLSIDQAFDRVAASEKINLSSLVGDVLNLDFAGIKLGDINGDWTNPNATTLSEQAFPPTGNLMSLGSPRVSPNGMVWVDIYAETSEGLEGMQFGLNWDEQILQLEVVENHQLQGYSPQVHSHLRGGRAIVVWDDATLRGVDIQANQPLMTLQFSLQPGADRGTSIHLTQPLLVGADGSKRDSMGVASYYHPEGGTLLSSQDLIQSLHRSEGGLRLEFETRNGMSYVVEIIHNLSHGEWQAVRTLEGSGRHEVVELNTTEQAQTYLRLREVSGTIK